jgi:hypothetical protein
MSQIIVCCEACGSEGRIYHKRWINDPEDWWTEICPYCEGQGVEFIESQPVDLEDAEFLAGGQSEKCTKTSDIMKG